MFSVANLPTLNAVLNAFSAIFLMGGYYFVRRRRIVAHKRCMLSAFGISTLFLVSYLIYHFQVGSIAFDGTEWIRPVYYAILISHIVLAAMILPLAIRTLYWAWRGKFAQHRRIAHWTLPIWFYVSITGIVIYWMLYQ
tara:strand:- start:461 stop:874 length:414 start_codon:yes stop_codon:yes gene_type:complete